LPIANVSFQLGTCRNFHPVSLVACPTYKKAASKSCFCGMDGKATFAA